MNCNHFTVAVHLVHFSESISNDEELSGTPIKVRCGLKKIDKIPNSISATYFALSKTFSFSLINLFYFLGKFKFKMYFQQNIITQILTGILTRNLAKHIHGYFLKIV